MTNKTRNPAIRYFAGSLGLCAAVVPIGATSDPNHYGSYNLYGTPGLLQMPTSESAPDAELAGTFAFSNLQRRTTLTFQMTQRLSGSFRYSKIPEYETDGSDRFDRSFDMRYRLIDEGSWYPSFSVGLQDFVGTGVYSGEYVVASKTFGDKFTVTGGLGWGRLGTNGDLGSPFGERTGDFEETGGTFNLDQLFKGPMAPFGGVSWRASDKLTLKAEYSSDAMKGEVKRGLVEYESPWNFGAEYKINNNTTLSGSYLYGSEVGVQLTFTANPKKPILGPGNETAPLPVKPRPSRSANAVAWTQDWASDQSRIAGYRKIITEALATHDIHLEAMSLSATSAELRIDNRRFMSESEAIGRTVRILTAALPASVETFIVTPVTDGIPNARVAFTRSDLEALENAPATSILSRAVVADAAGPAPAGMVYNQEAYPRFQWSLLPYLEFSLFDPEEPIRADIGLRLSGHYELAPGWVASGSISKRLIGNIDEITRESNSVLPHVRTDFPLYAAEGDPAIEHLTMAWFARPGTNLYSRVTAGYLEEMYAGVSGELLWKPVDNRLAFGAELNYVQQRDYDGGFGLLDYETVTGHVSAYYDLGNGYHTQVDVGRYLAEDWGATLTVDREFSNGWRVGAFATLTDVSFEDFGEGSFDKGIRLSIPVSWASGNPSKDKIETTIRPLTRDGGARLWVNDRLYERIRDSHQPQLDARGGRFWR